MRERPGPEGGEREAEEPVRRKAASGYGVEDDSHCFLKLWPMGASELRWTQIGQSPGPPWHLFVNGVVR